MKALLSILLLSGGISVSSPVGEWTTAGFVAEKSRHGVSVRGHLLSSRAKQDFLTEAARAGIEIAEFEYRRHIVLPDWWPVATQAMLPLAERLHSGQVRLSRNELIVEAVTREDANWSDAMSALKASLPDGFRISRKVSGVPIASNVAACQKLFENQDREPLLFRRTSTTVKTEHHGQLARLAAALRRCPDIAIRIVGHSDAYGIPARNQAVSEQRAKAVAEFLISLGVADAQLTSEGRGDREPVATNATWEGRNLNRRVTIARRD